MLARRTSAESKTLDGGAPNMLRNVREKCAESVNPAVAAASVKELPANTQRKAARNLHHWR